MKMDEAVFLCISAALIVIQNVQKRRVKSKRQRKIWMLDYFKIRNCNLITDLELNENALFRNFTRMSKNNFYALLEVVGPSIEKKHSKFRVPIPAAVRLAITLRFLATGDSYSSLMYLFRVSKSSISRIIREVLKAIIIALNHYVKMPQDEHEWRAVARDYHTLWNYPHCIGSLDGKHVVIQRPNNSRGEFYNYKGTHSVVLMAVVDANYNFIHINVGAQGRISDGGVFRNTEFAKRLQKGSLGLPHPEPLPGRCKPVPYVIVADDAFPLTENIMKPYTENLNKGSHNRAHNYRLSRARRTVENAFGILASAFRVFHKPIEVKLYSTIVDIILACVYLHNFLRSQPDSVRFYTPAGCFDHEDATGEMRPGFWREIVAGDNGLRRLKRIPRNSAMDAKSIRNEFREYFMSPQGSIPQQEMYL